MFGIGFPREKKEKKTNFDWIRRKRKKEK